MRKTRYEKGEMIALLQTQFDVTIEDVPAWVAATKRASRQIENFEIMTVAFT